MGERLLIVTVIGGGKSGLMAIPYSHIIIREK
jgi:hypothetical protein